MPRLTQLLAAFVAVFFSCWPSFAKAADEVRAHLKAPDRTLFDWEKVKCVYLEASRPAMDKEDEDGDLLVRELARQAVLITVRHGLGLQTRDQTLGDSVPTPGKGDIAVLQLTTKYISPKQLELQLNRREDKREQRVWSSTLTLEPKPGQHEYLDLIMKLEALSRGELLSAFRKAGASVAAAPAKGKATPDAAIETLLDRFSLIQQFDALRRLHARIQAEGESPVDLQGLVRGYANLGQLVQYHWTAASQACQARSLLYAQRLAAIHNESAAHWHRAYALALTGLPVSALEEFTKAENGQSANSEPPSWAVIGKEWCRYDFRALRARAEKGGARADLAWFLTVRALCGDRYMLQASVEATRKLLANDPECYPAYYYLYRCRFLGILHESTLSCTAALQGSLSKRLRACDGLPRNVEEALESESLLKDVPSALAEAGRAAADRGEPSWGALGRMLQETVFLQVYQRVMFMRDMWGVPADGYVQEVLPLLEGHPYQGFIVGLAIDAARDPAAHTKALEKVELRDIQLKSLHLIRSLQNQKRGDKTLADLALFEAFKHSGRNADDLADCMAYYSDAKRVEVLKDMRTLTPYNPAVVAELIRHDEANSAAHLAVAEKEFAHHPTVIANLAEAFERRKQWDAAIVWQKKLVEAYGGYNAYNALATLYERNGDTKRWQETLEEFLTKPSQGLDHAQVQVRLARYFMRQKDWAKAKPYAEAAAETYAEWALICAADCYEGLGQLDRSEEIMRQVSERYDGARTHWYFWCVRTGKGDLKAASQFAAEHLNRTKSLSLGDAEAKAIGYVIQGKPQEAASMFAKCFAASKASYDGLHLVAVHDEMGDAKARDAVLKDTVDSGAKLAADSPLLRQIEIAKLMQAALADQKALDLGAVEKALKDAPDYVRTNMEYFVGRFLELHGQKDKALGYYRRSADSDDKKRWNCAMASWRLRNLKSADGKADKPKQ